MAGEPLLEDRKAPEKTPVQVADGGNSGDQNLDLVRIVADTQSLRRSSTGLNPNQGSLTSGWNESYVDLWKSQPLEAGAVTGATALAGYAMWSKLPGVTTYGAGIYGATKFATADAHDLLTSRSVADVLKYGTSSAADLTMVAGLAARFVPQWRAASSTLTAIGAIGRVGASFLPDSNNFSDNTVTAPPSRRVTVDVPIEGGKTEPREFDVYFPQGVDEREKLPLMLVLHGVADGNAAGSMEKETMMNRLADEKHMAVAYPVAKSFKDPTLGMTIQDWNSPGAGLTAPRDGFDDVDYIKAIINKVGTMANLDQRAIYAAGFSSGGEFVQDLRGRMPGVFAGVASVHGTLLGTEAKPVDGDQTAFISVHSDSDQMLPYNGGRGLMTSINFPRIAESRPQNQIPVALRQNGYDGALPLHSTFNNIDVTEYRPTQPGQAPVKEYMIKGGWTGGMIGGVIGRGRDGFPAEHAWDGPGAGGWPVVGDKNRSLDVSRLVVEELLKYKKPDNLNIKRDLQ